jgi:hypothetical protein
MCHSGEKSRIALLASGYLALQVLFVLFAARAYLLRVDDAYYYFGIARRVVESGKFTFDGIHLTNGFQPLWQFVLIGFTWAAYALGIHGRDALVILYFLLCALLNTGAFLVAIRLGEKWFRDSYAMRSVFLFCVLWIPGWTTSLLSGMENSLYWLFLLLFMVIITDDSGRPSLRGIRGPRKYWLFLVSALLVYTRVDSVVILSVAAVYFLIVERSRSTWITVLTWAGVTLAAVTPLLLWELLLFDTPLPVSGSVKLLHTAKMIDRVGIDVYALGALKAFLLSVLGVPLSAAGMGYYEIVKPAVLGMGFEVPIVVLGLVALSLVAVPGILLARRTGAVRLAPRPASLGFLSIICAVHLGLNSFLFPEQWRFGGLIWYFVVEYLLLFLFVSWLVGGVLATWPARRRQWTRRIMGLGYLCAFVPMVLWRPALPSEQELKYIGAAWINEHVPRTTIVGAFNAGVTGYYSEVPVVNLDGLVNDLDFLRNYLGDDRIRDYIRERGIDFVADHGCECPALQTGWFWGYVHVPSEAQLRFCRLANEKGVNFCIVEITGLSPDL